MPPELNVREGQQGDEIRSMEWNFAWQGDEDQTSKPQIPKPEGGSLRVTSGLLIALRDVVAKARPTSVCWTDEQKVP